MNPDHHLTLTHTLDGTEPVFDDRAWRWALRDSGMLALVTPAETKLLLLIYCLADRRGRADVPTTWSAEALGLTPRAVREARKRLEARRLIVSDGASDVRRGVKAYRLVMSPKPMGYIAGTDEKFGNRSGEPSFRGGSCDPFGGEAGFPQRESIKEKENSGGNARAVTGEAPLYERPGYDRAAALLVEFCRMPKRVAHGLVTQYRPTAGQIQNIIDNIEARNAEPGIKPVSSRIGFATSAIKRCDYALDDRVITARRRDKTKSDVSARTAQQAIDTQEAQASALAQEQADTLTWDSLSTTQRHDLRTRALEQLKPWQRDVHKDHPDTNPIVRAMILNQYARDHQDIGVGSR